MGAKKKKGRGWVTRAGLRGMITKKITLYFFAASLMFYAKIQEFGFCLKKWPKEICIFLG